MCICAANCVGWGKELVSKPVLAALVTTATNAVGFEHCLDGILKLFVRVFIYTRLAAKRLENCKYSSKIYNITGVRTHVAIFHPT